MIILPTYKFLEAPDSLKLPNFLTTSQDVTKGANQANYDIRTLVWDFSKDNTNAIA